jgi:CDP-glucose 4,6-dehydratase
MRNAQVNPLFWSGKKVFLTGHTGFKGGWLAIWLSSMGAKVTGYSLAPNTMPNFFEVAKVEAILQQSHIADIRNLGALQKAILDAKPEIVIHMAAQPLVRYSYENPVETYATNVMGTVHVLESIRQLDSVRATVIVTTDKCYENRERAAGYHEDEAMGGFDPYSSSKGCAELITAAYRQSFFSSTSVINKVASARAGNVIGGGDWSEDRLIPDAIKAFENNLPLLIRNPLATRPWQHVLEPLSGYLVLAQALYQDKGEYSFDSAWNFGPPDIDARSVQEVMNLFIQDWGAHVNWQQDERAQPHEAHSLRLDCTKAYRYLNWAPKWSLEYAIQTIVQWHRAYQEQQSMYEFSLQQIAQYQQA